ncbi:flagellar hook-length control protein FliK [Brevundimonas aurifodinae]|uniref:Flagellar hook-length control protein FliK n=2 Tax=Brevundimonas TaxID=41275 RepID=A0ABV1NQE4_9CAUL|nr:MAG: hypothetical protein B7Z42_02015 [Brevundimonas sp. 12-68-7]OYX33292.1 MAG: hypothetical protein B7Z01_09315 [Brevundimonas subvibrioides]
MSTSAFAAVLGPITGSTAPARGVKADARPTSDDGDFATALRVSPASDVAAEPTPVRAGKGREEVAATEIAEAAPAVAPLVDVPATVATAAVPPPVLIPEAPQADVAVGVAPAAPALVEDQGDADALAGVAPSPDDEPAQASSLPVVDLKRPAQASAVVEAAQAKSAVADPSQRKPLPVEAAEPTAAPTEPRVVAPPASDRAREVAAARSAVQNSLQPPVRPAKGAGGASVATSPVPVEGAASPEGEVEPAAPLAPPLPAEPGRVRDVIDRATTRATSDAPSADSNASASGAAKSTESTGSSSTAAVPPKPAPASEIAPPPVASTLVAEEPPTTQSGAAPQPVPEAQAAEAAQAPGLSTLSRTAVETTAQIAAQIVRRLEGRSTRFEMALTPEGLGRVDISLDIEADGSLRATLAFDNPVAATDLRGRADELRRQLTDAGFTLADDALSFADRDPSAGQGGGFDRPSDRHNARAFGAASRLSVEADALAQAPSWIQLSPTPSGVDMKV